MGIYTYAAQVAEQSKERHNVNLSTMVRITDTITGIPFWDRSTVAEWALAIREGRL